MIINMEKTFIRVRSVKDIVIFTSLAVIGIILTVLPYGEAVNIAGFFIIFTAAILLLVLKSGYQGAETNIKYSKREKYFQQTMHSTIAAAVTSAPDSIDLSEEDKGNALRLDVYYSKSTGKAFVQLFEYVPYTYQPCSKMYEHEISKVAKLIK